MCNSNVERLTVIDHFGWGEKLVLANGFSKISYLIYTSFKESNKNVMVIGCWAENVVFVCLGFFWVSIEYIYVRNEKSLL